MSLTESDMVLFIETYKPLHTKEWNMRKLGMSLRESDSSLHIDIQASSHQGMKHEDAWMSLTESDMVLFIDTYKPLHTME